MSNLSEDLESQNLAQVSLRRTPSWPKNLSVLQRYPSIELVYGLMIIVLHNNFISTKTFCYICYMVYLILFELYFELQYSHMGVLFMYSFDKIFLNYHDDKEVTRKDFSKLSFSLRYFLSNNHR